MKYKYTFKEKAGKFNLLFVLLLLFSCEAIFLKPREFKNEFIRHTSSANSVLYDGDFLHPTYAFLKNGKIIGIEFNGNPECGQYTRRYFLDDDEKISKIIIEKDFYDDHCGKPFDSIFVIEIPTKQIKVYTKSTDGKIINNNQLIENETINIAEYKEKLKNWHYR